MRPTNFSPDHCLALVREEILRLCPDTAPTPQSLLEADLGLNSHHLVELLSALESRLDLGPSESLPQSELQTVDDLCRACQALGPSHADHALAASLLRGQARRRR
jgi:acyl carrier protein